MEDKPLYTADTHFLAALLADGEGGAQGWARTQNPWAAALFYMPIFAMQHASGWGQGSHAPEPRAMSFIEAPASPLSCKWDSAAHPPRSSASSRVGMCSVLLALPAAALSSHNLTLPTPAPRVPCPAAGNTGDPSLALAAAVRHVRAAAPFWNATHGRSHAAFLPGDRGACGLEAAPQPLQAPIKVGGAGAKG